MGGVLVKLKVEYKLLTLTEIERGGQFAFCILALPLVKYLIYGMPVSESITVIADYWRSIEQSPSQHV